MSSDKYLDRSKLSAFDKEDRQIAVVGIALRLPLANTIEEYWENLRNGKDCVRPYLRTDKSSEYLSLTGKNDSTYIELAYLDTIDKFDYKFFNLSANEAKMMEPAHRIFLETAWEAIEDAGYGAGQLSGSKTGVFVGYNSFGMYRKWLELADVTSEALAHIGTSDEMIAGRVSHKFNLKGPSMLINTACSSSLVSVHMACQSIITGDSELALVGGAHLSLLPTEDGQYMGIESPSYRTRAFDSNSNGTGAGEGICAILLKSLTHAERDGNHIYAIIKGSAVNQDGGSMELTAPNPQSQEDVLIQAWENADIDPKDITYIEAHGTGTKLGDPIEISSITRAFNKYDSCKKKQFCAVGSVKTNMGHLHSTAGIAGLIKAILALRNKEIPPSIHFNTPNPAINFINSPVYVNDRLLDWKTKDKNVCGVSSFGLSGTNCHVVLENYEESLETKKTRTGYLVFTISAKSKTALKEYISKYRKFRELKNHSTQEICYMANICRAHYSYRFAMIIKNDGDVYQKFQQIDVKNDSDCFRGYHEIVVDKRRVLKENQIYLHTKKELSDKANRFLNSFIIDKCQDVSLLKQICELYVSGADPHWNLLYSNQKIQMKRVPTYPFDQISCWADISYDAEDRASSMLYNITWESREENLPVDLSEKSVLFVYDNYSWGSKAYNVLTKKGCKITPVAINLHTKKITDDTKNVDGSIESYRKLFLDSNIKSITDIVFLSYGNYKDFDSIQDSSDRELIGFYNFFNLYQSLLKAISVRQVIRLFLMTCESEKVDGSEKEIRACNSAIIGLCKALKYESQRIKLCCIDLNEGVEFAKVIPYALSGKDFIQAYRNNKRYLQSLEKNENILKDKSQLPFKNGGVYIISGGTGYIGMEMTKFISKRFSSIIYLVSRSGSLNENVKLKNEIEILQMNGSKINILQTDVTDEQQVVQMVRQIIDLHKTIDGIIHCAGKKMKRDSIINCCKDDVLTVLNTKIKGAVLLDRHTKKYKPTMLLMSSASTIIGGKGIADYVAANSYLNSFCDYRNNKGLRTVAILWTTWRKTAEIEKLDNNSQLFLPINEQDALNTLNLVLANRIDKCIIGEINTKGEIYLLQSYLPFRIGESVKKLISTPEIIRIKNKSKEVKIIGKEDPITETEKKIANVIGALMNFEEVNIYDDLFDLGANSIIAVKIETELEEIGFNIKASQLYEYKTIYELAILASGEDVNIKSPIKKQLETETTETEQKPYAQNKGIKIDHIEPYNEIFFKNCFFNVLFSVMKSYGVNEIPFLINSIISFSKDEDDDYTVNYLEQKKLLSILEEVGIECKTLDNYDNVLYDLKQALEHNHVVAMWIDCCYESLRTDVYHIQNWAHTILIYGYDQEKDIYHIIEHPHKDNLQYGYYTIPSHELLEACKSFERIFTLEEDQYLFCELYKKESENRSEYVKFDMEHYKNVFKMNLHNKKSVVIEGFKYLDEFIDKFAVCFTGSNISYENSEKFVKSINMIINAKVVEEYRINLLFENNTKLKILIAYLLDDWKRLRNILTKCVYRNVYKKENIDYCMCLLNEIKQIERLFLTGLETTLKYE